MIANILVDIKAKEVDRTFDYLVPHQLQDVIEIGQRVQVPFGPRLIMGYVMGFSDSSDFKRLRSIKTIMDIIPSLTPELIELGKELAIKNTSSLVSIYQAMLPSALKSSYKKVLRVKDTSLLPLDVALRFNRYKEVPFDDSLKDHLKIIKDHITTGNIEVQYRVKQLNKVQFYKQLTLVEEAPVRGTKQQALIAYLKEHGTTKKQTIMSTLSLSNATVKSLVEKGIIVETQEEYYREVDHIYKANNKRVTLLEEQQVAYDKIREKQHEHTVFLLHGVTGSGKTEIYLNIIEDVVNQGKDAIMLVPEISLTPMMVSRFKGRFHNNVALLHSRLSVGEKYDEWRKIRRQEVQVVVGARSAIFAPFTNLGVIIIDEEHTDSYKQDTIPLYHARDVAIERAKKHSIPLILGSATPSVESYHHALQGDYQLLELHHRANQTTLPEVYIEDMRYEFQGGNRSIFSKRLHQLIEDRLQKKEQVILLLNRRGHSTFVMCRNCGEVVMCPNCDISLTYHEHKNSLKCHYCGHEEDNPTACPYCGSPHIRYMGIGTEKVEEYVKTTFPDATVVRMDSDTTTFKNAHEQLLYEFEHEGDILIGTQMIAKGLDFPNVTLVGVLAADMSLNLPDYKAIEHTFQLLTQVSGRAGRHDKEGEVVIQTYNPDHYAIMYAKNHDYQSFYNTEMKIREVAGYTPFYQLVQIIVSDKDVKHVLKTGTKIVLNLRKSLDGDVMILGPVLPKIARINNVFRAQIIIKYQQCDNIDPVLKELYQSMQDTISIAIDTNPSLL
jgi:primosomal protein N' (replication factor Y)